MSSRFLAALALALLLAAPAGAAEPDSLEDFLRERADSTDAYFGPASTRVDTTGLDSLAAWAFAHADSLPARALRSQFIWAPRLRFHRAEGAVAGGEAGLRYGDGGMMRIGATYGFSHQQPRYDAEWRHPLLTGGGLRRRADGRVGSARRLEVIARAGRRTEYFMRKHATPFVSSVGALLGGRDRQSVYESRDGELELRWTAGSASAGIAWHHARERSMPLVTRFSVWGAEPEVPEVTAADEIEYDEARLHAAWKHEALGLAVGGEARVGAPRGLRLRLAAAKEWRVGPWLHAATQLEAGAADAQAPPQRRFELGGPLAVPSLGFGGARGSHLLLGKLDLFYAGGLPLPLPEWLRLDGGLFVHGGAAWDDAEARDVVFTSPPRDSWRGAFGPVLAWRPGIPDPDVQWRVQYAWPIGPHSGEGRVSVSFTTSFDLLSDR